MKIVRKENNKSEYRKSRKMRGLMVAAGWLLSAAAFVAGGLIVVGVSGRYNLQRRAVSYAAENTGIVQAMSVSAASSGGAEERQESRGGYDEIRYQYNNDILTFLFIGINDKKQADALFLLTLDPHEELMELIPIDPGTMTDIDVYDEQGMHRNTMTAQIGSQYGFGDGGRKSCEYQIGAVRNLFHGIPVNGYLAVDMDVLPDVIRLIDGMDNEAPEEVSADGRMAIQTYYLTEFISRVKQQSGADFTIPVKIYSEIADRVITDITVDEVVYLAALAGGYRFDAGQVVTIPEEGRSTGENETGGHNAFYADREALDRLILDIFYESVR